MAPMPPTSPSSKLKCVMFCEFDPHLGPQVKYQHPMDFISKEQMDSIARYIITKPSFQGHLISLRAFGYIFMGYPVGITNKKYPRNVFHFNVVFVFDQDSDVTEFEPLVSKLAGYLATLEVESGYLSEEETRENIPDILKKIQMELGTNGECTIPVNNCNTIYLKINNLPTEPPVVLDHHVPVFLWSKTAIESQHWDLTAKRVIPYIDGFNHVQKIATLANVNLTLLRSALQTLVFHGVISLIPMFLYSNMYSVKPKVHALFNDESLQSECLSYVAKDDKRRPNFRDVFMLYCALGPGISVNALCSRHDPSSLGIDEKKLIQFGLIKEFIHKLGKYPVLQAPDDRFRNISKWMNGQYSYEEICCKSTAMGEPLQYHDLVRMTEYEPHILHIWK